MRHDHSANASLQEGGKMGQALCGAFMWLQAILYLRGQAGASDLDTGNLPLFRKTLHCSFCNSFAGPILEGGSQSKRVLLGRLTLSRQAAGQDKEIPALISGKPSFQVRRET